MHYFINIFIFASCIIATILAADLDLVDLWLNRQELNKYGDSVDTMYAGGSPLFNENTWEIVDRYLYLTTKFPSFPWLDNYEEEKEGPTPLDEGGACVDTVGEFPNWFGSGNARNCEFVEESWTMLKCLLYAHYCPETCGRPCDQCVTGLEYKIKGTKDEEKNASKVNGVRIGM